ncbi:diguanylate cyclase [Maridesulfovibrio sp. FT414]|uniref:diguanylate cyclase n=1 Tax=Maridesulfovibrio sp. FT414 TaxID=2979469 RepID=UPI003D803C79
MIEFNEADDALFYSAFTYAAIGMAIVAPDGSWLKVNNALCDTIGYSAQELMSKTFQDITHPDDLDEDLRFVNQLLAGDIETYQMEKRYFHKYGDIIHILLNVSLVKNEDGSPRFFISQIQDITQKKKLESELARMAREDELTKVFNRRYFMEIATREVIRGSRFREPQALMMIDIDHFKRINDTYGHDIGDLVLRAMADECSKSLRKVDVFGRLGGEEFGALLLGTDSEVARMLAERMRMQIESLVVKTPKDSIKLTVSIGVAAFTETNMPLEALIKKADESLYEAKDTGRNKVVVSTVENVDHSPPEAMRTSFVRLEWKKEYESGCKTIDRQHQNLFLLANDLLAAIISGLPDEEVDFIAQGLMNHVLTHFREEDILYRKAGYPGADIHSRLHYSLIQDMRSTLDRFKKKQVSVGDLFTLMAIKIVKEHLLIEDRKFFPYLSPVNECQD